MLAHEIAHVTQRHVARSIQAAGRSSLVSAAAMLAAIVIGATTGMPPDVMTGAIAVAQGAAAQQRINFTRSNEYEADRIGIGTMAASGFDPQAMPAFFDTMGRRAGLQGSQVPELLQSHPVTTARIAESRNRAHGYDIPLPPDSVSYGLSRERLRLLSLSSDTDARAYYNQYLATEKSHTDATRYGQALSLMQSGAPEEAIPILQGLSEKHTDVMQYRSALGEAQMAIGEKQESLSTFARAQITVIDNGCGLPKEDRHRLVEPYMTTRAKGTGLGLAIVQRITEQHGGTLTLADAPKRNGKIEGASVRIDLPVGEKEEAIAAEAAAEPGAASASSPSEHAEEEEGVTHGV